MKKLTLSAGDSAYLRQYDFSQVSALKFLYRIDQFGDQPSDYVVLGFGDVCTPHRSLKTMEADIEEGLKSHVEHDKNQPIEIKAIEDHLPQYLGVIPYEMAQDFLPIRLNKKQTFAYLIQASSHLLIHKQKDEVVVMGQEQKWEKVIKAILGDRKEAAMRLALSHDNSQVAPLLPSFSPDQMLFKIDFERYQKMISESRDHIHQGDIFQVVLSNTVTLDLHDPPYDIYKKQSQDSKMAYQCLIHLAQSQESLLINSPELLVKNDDDYVYTRPIAGTRARKYDGKDDERQDELKNDPKENAEHLMLVDLGRNDLQKLAQAGSVRLSSYKEVKGYDHVFHMVSEVVAKKAYKHVLDPIRATFPAGTVSGAPKIMAMQIIDQLESETRGFYAGTTFIINQKGHLESCINLRSIFIEKDKLRLQVGSGIVDDSNAVDENKELINKMKGQALVIQSEVTA